VVDAARSHRFSSLLLHTLQTVHPVHQMALGFGNKKAKEAGIINNDVKSPEDVYDPEDQSNGGRRRVSRVVGDDNSSTTLSIGKQIELEADNAIKYRTCSWQKVCSIILRLLRDEFFMYKTDQNPRRQPCCFLSTFVWLSCHSRIPILFLDLCPA
jgi:hypothetical protein